MITDGLSTSVGAGATVNVFIGRPVEFVGVASVMRLLLIADAIAQTAQLLINVGGSQIVPLAAGTPLGVSSVAGAGPKDDEDTYVPSVAIPAGARLQLNITNGGGGAVISRYRAILAP